MMRKLLKLFILFLLFNHSNLLAQNIIIKGSVISNLDKQPLIGASVGIKGTTKGTITDDKGNYTLSIPTKDVSKTILIARYIGFIAAEISVANKTIVNFSLIEDALQLKEVVAIGYATIGRKDLTGAVSSINAKQLKDIPLSSAAEALTGRLAGVQVTSSEGAPGAEVQIKIRGGGSITQDNSPLYIIDGIQVEDGLNNISPQDIESIDVLKDASSTSIYGARGANGVIIITTKGGKDAKPQVTYSNILGIKSLSKKLDVMNPYEYVVRQYEKSRGLTNTESSFQTRYGTWADIEQYKNVPFIDWQEQTFGNDAFMQTHNFGINGGNKISQYNLSLTSNNEDGIMINSSLKRKLVNFRFDTQVSEGLKAGFNVRFSDQDIGGSGTSNDGSSTLNTLRHTIKFRPLEAGGISLDEDDEQYYSDTNTGNAIGIINPIQLSNALFRNRSARVINLNGYANYKFDKHFSFRSTLGINYNNQLLENFEDGITSRARIVGANLPIVGVLQTDLNTLLNSNVLTYNFTKSKKHKLDILLGNELYNITSNTEDNQLRYFPANISSEKALGQLNLGTIFPGYPITNKAESKTVSFFGRSNYSFNQKYLASLSLRADASSRFSEENRWGYFPSGAFAWRISEEKFLEDIPIISDLKLRLSYGSAGNDRISDYLYQNIYTASARYALNEQIIPAYAAANLANKNLVWETTISKNIGLDISLWKDKVQLTVDAYKNKVNNLLINVPIPSTTGYNTQLQNIGNTSNKGLEFQLSAVTINKKNFSWNNTFNISFNRNKIEKLANNQSSYFENSGFGISGQPADYIVKVGEPVGTMYGYVNDGFYKTDDFNYDPATSIYTLKANVPNAAGVIGTPQPGWMKLKDLDGNNIINENDKTIIGNANPKFIGGLNQQFVYKNFDMSVFVNFVFGNDVYNANKIEFTNGYSSYTNSLSIVNNRWKTIDQNGNLVQQLITVGGQQVVTGAAPDVLNSINKDASTWIPISGVGAWFPTSWAIEDGSFLRINNITFGYTLPTKIVKHIGINKMRLYGTVNNLAVITGYSGYDPEVNTRRSVPVTPGVDYSAYPRNKTFIVGLNLSL
ncbi:SusC/RagA family protein [Pedobacter psychrophilus]|uniref:SusC/RagA family protein n=1 Tax=Pedobacter psychrophilus TaxID=1826909 RepID=A0A179DAE2_9SPHI|nr:TonB-dependent receptor [Pedobacter psychrophilus]OAQ38015.1 SusC/RagA family protein [Pedobacter psychrophilus]